jgi:hypothetical protein
MLAMLAVLCLLQLLHPHLVDDGAEAEERALLAWIIEAASLFCLLAALRQAVSVIGNLIGRGDRR